jgi:hypothetical protein
MNYQPNINALLVREADRKKPEQRPRKKPEKPARRVPDEDVIYVGPKSDRRL